MKENETTNTTKRRGFIATLTAGAAALGLAAVSAPFNAIVQQKQTPAKKPIPAKDPADEWFNKVRGSHRVVYDATRPHEIMPFAWPKVFLLTNQATGTPETDCGVVVVLRHDAIGYAFKDSMWAKYNFGDLFKAHEIGPAFKAADAETATKTRNPFWNSKPGDFAIPGFGAVPISINDLQASGVMFCVCNAAMTVYSNAIAGNMGMKAEDIYNEWKKELIPGIQIVPSGVWALGRAQEHGCKYIFAG